MTEPGRNGAPHGEPDPLEALAAGLEAEDPAPGTGPGPAPCPDGAASAGHACPEGPDAGEAASDGGVSTAEVPVEPEAGAEAAAPDGGAAEPPPPARRAAILEALLFASATPVRPGDLQEACGWSLAILNRDLERLSEELAGRGVELQKVAGAWRLVTAGEVAPYVERLLKVQSRKQLSRAQLETLAVVAWRQPVTRAEVDAYRGVRSERTLQQLGDMRLVREVGRAELPGRPIQYGTSAEFLRYFGLDRLEDLPMVERGSVHLRRHAAPPVRRPEPPPAPEPEEAAPDSSEEIVAPSGEEGLPGPSAGLRKLLNRIRRREERESREG